MEQERRVHTFVDKLGHFIAYILRLLEPPTPEEGDLDVDESSIGVLFER